MKIHKTKIIVVFILIFLVFASCTPVPPNSSTSVATDTLNFRITWDSFSGRGEAIQKIVGSYNEESTTGTYISMVSGDENKDSIEALLRADNADTIFVLPYRYVKYFGGSGYLDDLSLPFDYAEELFYPELWKLGTVNKTVYGIPWLGHSICLLYNKNLLNEAGVDPSSITSLDSWVNAMNAVEANTDAAGVGLVGAESNDISWMVNQFIYGFGGTLVDDSGTKVTINSERSKSAIEFYRDVLGAHAQSTWLKDTGVEVMSCFLKQKVAFEFQGIWGVTDIEKNGSPFDVGIIALSDIGLHSEVGPMMLAIPATMSKERKNAAYDFIKYMISTGAQEKIMDGEYSPEHDAYYPFRTPIRLDMAQSAYFTVHPEYQSFLIGFGNPSIDVPVPAWQTIKDSYYAPGLHQVMTGKISINDFLTTIETEGDKILSMG